MTLIDQRFFRGALFGAFVVFWVLGVAVSGAFAGVVAGGVAGSGLVVAHSGAVSGGAAGVVASDPVVGSAGVAPRVSSGRSSSTGGVVGAEPAVIAAGAADVASGGPSRVAGGGPSRVGLDQPIVFSSRRGAGPVRLAVAQLASGGPLVAASGSAGGDSGTARSRAMGRQPGRVVGPVRFGVDLRRAAGVVVGVSVPVVGVFVGSRTSAPPAGESGARRAGVRASGSVGQPVGPSGLSATTVSSFGAGSLGLAPGALFGSAPFLSANGAAAVVGFNVLLAAVTLLLVVAWRRRSWDLPVVRGESALFSSVRDRPG